MANFSRILPKQFLPGMNVAQAWVDVAQSAANEPFLQRLWPGMILFGSESSINSFSVTHISSNGHKVLTDAGGTPWYGAIQYIQNGEWLSPGQSDTVPKPTPAPAIDVLCVNYSTASPSYRFPLKIVSVIDSQNIVVEDSMNYLGGIGEQANCWFAKSDLYPNKEIQMHDTGYINIIPLGGAAFQSELDTTFAASFITIKQTGEAPIVPIGIVESGAGLADIPVLK